MHVNIRSLLPKFVLLTVVAHSASPDVLAVSESWLRNTTKNPEISIPNYTVTPSDMIELPKGAVLPFGSSILSENVIDRDGNFRIVCGLPKPRFRHV